MGARQTNSAKLLGLVDQSKCGFMHVGARVCVQVCVCVAQKGLPSIFGSILCKNSTLCVTLRLFWPAAKRQRARGES